MQIDFEDIEIPHFPGTYFNGSADVEWDYEGDGFWITTIQFGDVIYTRSNASTAGIVTVWDALMNKIIDVYADELDELRPVVRNEHAFSKHEYGLR